MLNVRPLAGVCGWPHPPRPAGYWRQWEYVAAGRPGFVNDPLLAEGYPGQELFRIGFADHDLERVFLVVHECHEFVRVLVDAQSDKLNVASIFRCIVNRLNPRKVGPAGPAPGRP